MDSFWANLEAQQKIVDADPTLRTIQLVLWVVFVIAGFFLARKVLKDAKVSGRNGMLWAGLIFLSFALLEIFGFIPLAIFYLTNKQQATQPQMRSLSGEMIKCPSCNFAKNPPGSDTCGLCGRPLPILTATQSDTQTKTCSSCGDSNPATNKFCRNCGKQL